MKSFKKLFKPYNKQEILDTFSKLKIERSNDTVYTKFNNRLICTTDVSNRYEVFDIMSYVKDILPKIESNFEIKYYFLSIRGGVQMLELLSEQIEINGTNFHKSFFIINSTNKSRALSFNLGLKASGFFMVGSNLNLYKKHYKGITEKSDTITGDVEVESFEEQIQAIKGLSGHKVLFSNVRKVILGENESKAGHKKFDAFKNLLRYGEMCNQFNDKQIKLLNTNSEKISDIEKDVDFYIDAYYVFKLYLSIFSNLDAYVVKKETKKIFDITQWAIRNDLLEQLGI